MLADPSPQTCPKAGLHAFTWPLTPQLTFPLASDTCAGWAAPRFDYETIPWGRERETDQVRVKLGARRSHFGQDMPSCQAAVGWEDPAGMWLLTAPDNETSLLFPLLGPTPHRSTWVEGMWHFSSRAASPTGGPGGPWEGPGGRRTGSERGTGRRKGAEGAGALRWPAGTISCLTGQAGQRQPK